MNSRANEILSRPDRMIVRFNLLFFSILGVVLLLHQLGLLPRAAAFSAQAQGAAISLDIRDFDTGDPIPNFTYLVNEDNTGDPMDPDPMMHPSMKPMESYSPIVAAGDQSTANLDLPDGRYLISVRADGYKLWGAPLTLPEDAGTVTIELVPAPTPLAMLRVLVFHDWASPNGFPDHPCEFAILPAAPPGEIACLDLLGGQSDDMSGFNVVLDDGTGEVGVDWWGNPICSEYDGTGSSTPLGDPIPGSGGTCLTAADGTVEIRNLPPGKYGIHFIPADGTDWVQTTTFEGTRTIDAWLEEGTDGRGAVGEILVEPFVQTAFFAGFVDAMDWGDPRGIPPGGAQLSGTVRNAEAWPPFEQLVLGEPVYKPWVVVTDLSTDTQVYRARGDADGNFFIPNVPAGNYQLVIFDEFLHYIMAFYTIEIGAGENKDLGDLGIFRWFGWASGHVFMDTGEDIDGAPIPGATAGDGIRDCDPGNPERCEPGFPNEEVIVRYRDGSVETAAITDNNGFWENPEMLSPLGRFEVLEVGFGRLARTGHSVHDEHDPDLVRVVAPDLGGGLLLSQLTWEGKRTVIDWGKVPYDLSAAPPESGGIAGAVLYGTTRNEFDPSLGAAEDYEPGIPDVTVRLWGLGPDGLGNTPDDILLNEIQSDAWQHPNAANGNACDVRDKNGVPLVGAIFDLMSDNCIEVPQLSNETHEGAWDGGWAIESVFPSGNLSGPELPIPPGDYIVEVVPPPFYQIMAEEDQNTDEGVGQEPGPFFAPPACAGDPHLVIDPRNPADGTSTPLCNKKLVRLQPGMNAAADFFLFTDGDTDPTTKSWSTSQAVPPPGRFFGLVEDDIRINDDPNSIAYGEPVGVPFVPIGIYDYQGRLFDTIYTDENGYYEVLLPSTLIIDAPIPGGVAPGMYVLVINDPGRAADPNPGYRTSYLTEPAAFDIWPGKMTPTDTPLDPINTIVCNVPPGTPTIFQVSQPVANAGSLPTDITILGSRFSDPTLIEPLVTLGGVTLQIIDWIPATPYGPDMLPYTADDDQRIFEDAVVVRIPAGFPAGKAQLEITNQGNANLPGNPNLPAAGAGGTNVNGLTFHVLGAGYNPPVINVSPPADPNDAPLQAAILGAPANSLILVEPGNYRENLILDRPVTLQGYGPGGIVGAGNVEAQDYPCPEPEELCPPVTLPGEEPFAHIQGSVIDGRYFAFDGTRRADWEALLGSLSYDGPGVVPNGAAITLIADDGDFGSENASSSAALIDGLGISSARGEAGGGIYVHAYGRNLEISNNILRSHTGGTGGAIVLGQPGVGDSQNDNAYIHHNRILENGGVNFAGGVGIFNGADNYEFAHNDVCGNFSLEYGGGLSHFGYSPNGWIHDNLIYFNDAVDEGGGLLVGGEQFPTPLGLGSGPVEIESNLILANITNDDGGGLEVLRPLTDRIDIVNNMIVNNVAADIGGGLVLDDASNVVMINNTVAGNVSTHTAEDSILGEAHGAGLVSELNSAGFQALLPPGAPDFSDPVMFNNIFWDNLAYRYDVLPNEGEPDEETGLGLVLTDLIDLEVYRGGPGECLSPTHSVLSRDYGPGAGHCNLTHASNIVTDLDLDPLTGESPGPFDLLFVNPVLGSRLEIQATPNRLDLNEIVIFMEREGLEGTLIDYVDYHLLEGALAIDSGTDMDVLGSGEVAPDVDIDDDCRPMGPEFDIGADEFLNDCLIQGLEATNNGPVELGSAVTFEATITQGDNVVYRWDFGDGSPIERGAAVTHQYSQVGIYTATLKAQNAAGISEAHTIAETMDIAVAGLTAVNDGPTQLGQTTSLTATVAAGTNVNFIWDYGDGMAGMGAKTSHVYACTGVFDASVTAYNSVSSVQAGTSVTINDGGYVPITVPPAGGTFNPGAGVTVVIDSGTFSEAVDLTYVEQPAKPIGDLLDVGLFYELYATRDCLFVEFPAGNTYEITVTYDQANVPADLDEAELALYSWDGSSWVREDNSTVDVDANTVTATPGSFGTWAVLAEPPPPPVFDTFLPAILKDPE